MSATCAVALDQTPEDLEAAASRAELIGSSVFSADGREIGELSDLSTADDGRVTKIRITMPAVLGLGPRIIEISDGAFVILRGAVVLDLPAEALDFLPSAPPEDQAEEK